MFWGTYFTDFEYFICLFFDVCCMICGVIFYDFDDVSNLLTLFVLWLVNVICPVNVFWYDVWICLIPRRLFRISFAMRAQRRFSVPACRIRLSKGGVAPGRCSAKICFFGFFPGSDFWCVFEWNFEPKRLPEWSQNRQKCDEKACMDLRSVFYRFVDGLWGPETLKIELSCTRELNFDVFTLLLSISILRYKRLQNEVWNGV